MARGARLHLRSGVAKVEGYKKRFTLVTSAVELTGLQMVELFAARFRQEDGFPLLDRLWEGKVDEAFLLLHEALGWVRNPKAWEDLIGCLEKRRAGSNPKESVPWSGVSLLPHAR